LPLKAGGLDNTPPLGEFVGENLAEFGRCSDLDFGAEVRKSCTCLRFGKAIVDAALSFSVISGEVPAGATTASQNVSCSFGYPAAVTVGTSGNFEARSFEVTASGRSLPATTCGNEVVIGSTAIWECGAHE
jgi:hypothetical protein